MTAAGAKNGLKNAETINVKQVKSGIVNLFYLVFLSGSASSSSFLSCLFSLITIYLRLVLNTRNIVMRLLQGRENCQEPGQSYEEK